MHVEPRAALVNAEAAGCGFLVELSFLNGRSVLSGLDVRSLLTV